MSLEMITPVNDVFRRDLELADPTLLDPTDATALVQGEWLVRNGSGKGVRLGAASALGSIQVFSQKGDTAAQAIGKVACLQLHQYEAETDMFQDGGAGFANGTELTVKQITVDAVTRSGLTQAAGGDFVYGFVTKNPTVNGGKLRFQTVGVYKK